MSDPLDGEGFGDGKGNIELTVQIGPRLHEDQFILNRAKRILAYQGCHDIRLVTAGNLSYMAGVQSESARYLLGEISELRRKLEMAMARVF